MTAELLLILATLGPLDAVTPADLMRFPPEPVATAAADWAAAHHEFLKRIRQVEHHRGAELDMLILAQADRVLAWRALADAHRQSGTRASLEYLRIVMGPDAYRHGRMPPLCSPETFLDATEAPFSPPLPPPAMPPLPPN